MHKKLIDYFLKFAKLTDEEIENNSKRHQDQRIQERNNSFEGQTKIL